MCYRLVAFLFLVSEKKLYSLLIKNDEAIASFLQ